ncbi:MAG TPA: 3-deoxy-8-phosphooctulonate synthase [bacterium]|nr:3-deoxy-8-phosphooctulonate synthase [bacterium]
MASNNMKIGAIQVDSGGPLFVIAGLCVLESEALSLSVAHTLKEICSRYELPYLFKASFDKANRSSLRSSRGPGIEKGLEILKRIKEECEVPVVTDVHEASQVMPVAEVVDVLQIPAFLCRQTDLLIAAAETGRTVSVKKGQFLAPWEMKNVVEKIESVGNHNILLVERGTTFGYNNLVVDFRSIPMMRSLGYPVVFDCTHSLQMPGSLGERTGGQPEFIPTLARAAVAAGADGVFLETHPSPRDALSDGANCLILTQFESLIESLAALSRVRKQFSV